MLDLARMSEGLNLRLAVVRAICSRAPVDVGFARRKESIGRDFVLREFDGEYQASRESFKDIEILTFIFGQRTLQSQQAATAQLAGYGSHRYLDVLALGAFRSGAWERSPPIIESSIDYSIYASSWLANVAEQDTATHRAAEAYLADASQLLGVSWPLKDIGDLGRMAKRLGLPNPTLGISDLQNFAHDFQKRFWWVYGPDFGAILMSVSNFREAPKNYDLSRHLAKRWGLDSALQSIADVRQVAKRRIAPVRHDPERAARIERYQRRLRYRNATRGWLDLEKQYCSVVTDLIADLWAQVRDGHYDHAYRSMILLFEIDSALLDELDWKYISRSLPPSSNYPSLQKSFVDQLFLRQGIVRSNPEISWKWGPGVFMGSFSWLLEARQRSRKGATILPALFQQIRAELPPNAASDFTNFLMERPNVERLARSYSDPVRIVEAQIGREEMLTPTVRVQLAELAAQHGLISADRYGAVLEEERRIVAVLHFQRALSTGRIRVPWGALRDCAESVLGGLERRLLYLRSEARELLSREDQAFLRAVCSEPIATFLHRILSSSAWAVDRLLSNNLRHGVILARYHAAFGSALNAGIPGSTLKLTWDDEFARKHLGDSFDVIQALNLEVKEMLQDFMKEFLTITDDRAIARNLKTTIESLAYSIVLHSGTEPESGFVPSVLAAVKDEIAEFVSTAHERFSGSVRPSVMAAYDRMRAALNPANRAQFSHILDHLKVELDRAGDDLASWIQLAEDSSQFVAFDIPVLLDLELELIHRKSRRQVDFSCRCIRIVGQERRTLQTLRARGNAFEALNEVVHNLVSNAVKHSRLGLRCRLELEIIHRGEDLEIFATNLVSAEGLLDVIEKLEVTKAAAAGDAGFNAGSDSSSGFQKIREVCERVLEVSPRITVGNPSKRGGFSVRVVLPRAASKVLQNG